MRDTTTPRASFFCRFLSVLMGLMIFAAQSSGASMTLEQKYQDVFVSAGYATAMGAAAGAALLVFHDKPEENLRYIAVGASVGFFAGTAFGTYMVIAPAFSMNDKDSNHLAGHSQLSLREAKPGQLVLQPSVNTKSLNISNLQAGMVFAQF
jgi:hypothetical protein